MVKGSLTQTPTKGKDDAACLRICLLDLASETREMPRTDTNTYKNYLQALMSIGVGFCVFEYINDTTDTCFRMPG